MSTGMFICHLKKRSPKIKINEFTYPLPSKNKAPDNRPSQKETGLPTIDVYWRAVKLQGCTWIYPRSWPQVGLLNRVEKDLPHSEHLQVQSPCQSTIWCRRALKSSFVEVSNASRSKPDGWLWLRSWLLVLQVLIRLPPSNSGDPIKAFKNSLLKM